MSDDVHHGHDHRPDWAALERDWRAVIERSGWMVMAVGAGDDGPAFQYTVGLTAKGLPEVVVYGLPQPTGHTVLNDLAARLVAGESFPDGEEVPDLVGGGYRVELWDATWLQDPLGAAFRLYGREAVRVRQLVLPDREHRMPWEDDYADGHLQPQLFAHPGGTGPRAAVPAAVSDATDEPHEPGCGDDVSGWDLPDDPHRASIVTGYVANGSLPALLVVHDADGDWQFLDDLHPPVPADAALLCLHHLVDADPTLAEVVRALGPGRRAVRDVVGGPWAYSDTVS